MKKLELVPLTEIVPRLLNRLVCVFRDHSMGAFVQWDPEVICVHFVCERCRKHLAHFDLPATRQHKVYKEKLH